MLGISTGQSPGAGSPSCDTLAAAYALPLPLEELRDVLPLSEHRLVARAPPILAITFFFRRSESPTECLARSFRCLCWLFRPSSSFRFPGAIPSPHTAPPAP